MIDKIVKKEINNEDELFSNPASFSNLNKIVLMNVIENISL